VEYLGYIIGSGGLRMDSAKVQVIQDWPEPKKVKDVQSFLGFANFSRHFIHGYSEIILPLIHLTRKTTPWNFDDNCHFAFQTLKDAFITAPVLTHWKPGHSLIVETDASDYTLAGILSMQDNDSEIRPIAFVSRTFSGAKLNYDVHDKELLAIYEAFRSWHHYLEGASSQIDVVTDHKYLQYFATTKLLSQRQARWSEYLSAFNMVIRFWPGCLGTKPDALTRRPDLYPSGEKGDYGKVNPHNLKPIFSSEQLSVRATAERLSRDLAGDPKHIYKHKIRQESAPSRGS